MALMVGNEKLYMKPWLATNTPDNIPKTMPFAVCLLLWTAVFFLFTAFIAANIAIRNKNMASNSSKPNRCSNKFGFLVKIGSKVAMIVLTAIFNKNEIPMPVYFKLKVKSTIPIPKSIPALSSTNISEDGSAVKNINKFGLITKLANQGKHRKANILKISQMISVGHVFLISLIGNAYEPFMRPAMHANITDKSIINFASPI